MRCFDGVAYFAALMCSAISGCALQGAETQTTDHGRIEEAPILHFPVPTTGFHPFVRPSLHYSIETGPLPGPVTCASDIGVGSPVGFGTSYILGCDGGTGNKSLYRLDDSGSPGTEVWTSDTSAMSNLGVRVVVPPDGVQPWVVRADGSVLRQGYDDQFRAQIVPGFCLKDLAIGSNEDAWMIGCFSAGSGGYEIYHLTGGFVHGKWARVPGAATKISVSPSGVPWVVTAQGSVYRWETNHFAPSPQPGCVVALAVNDVTAFALGCTQDPMTDNFGVYQWMGDSSGWRYIPGVGAQRVGVSPEGVAWLVDADGNIFVAD